MCVLKPAADSYRPLVSTPGQDLSGYLLGHLGKALLFLVTCSSVLAVLLIFLFVFRETLPFLSLRYGTVTGEAVKFGSAPVSAALGTYDVEVTVTQGEITAAHIKTAGEDVFREALIIGDTIKGRMELDARGDPLFPEHGMELDIDLNRSGSVRATVTVVNGFMQFLTRTGWYPEARPAKFGALALIAGSGYVTLAALVFAVPIGILAALFLSDIVSFKVRNVVKPVIEVLAAIPSVAYGFFAVLVLAPWLQNHLGFSTGTNALNAAMILAIMALPTVISVAEDSISALGRELREASYSLGATRMETLFKVVIPAAHSGIIAAIVLGMMRAVGETMVVWMASGNATQIPSPWWDLSQSVRTMTATIAGEMGETEKGSMHYSSLFAVGTLLLLVTLSMNLISEFFLARARKALGK
jgi:phosphate transport system permease protein